jgi:excisionase family DNA binding protein
VSADFESLWDANDVAAYLKCSRSLVYQKAEAGLLPSLRIGGLLRFDQGQVRRWALGKTESARVLPLRRF